MHHRKLRKESPERESVSDAAHREEVARLSEQLATARTEVKFAQSERDKLAKQLAASERYRRELKEVNQGLRDDISSLQTENTELTTKIEEANAKTKELEESIDTLNSKSDVLQTNLDVNEALYQTRVSELVAAVDAIKAAHDESEQSHAMEIEEARDQLNAKAKYAEELETELEKHIELSRQLQTQLVAAQALTEAKSRDHQLTNARLKETQKKLLARSAQDSLERSVKFQAATRSTENARTQKLAESEKQSLNRSAKRILAELAKNSEEKALQIDINADQLTGTSGPDSPVMIEAPTTQSPKDAVLADEATAAAASTPPAPLASVQKDPGYAARAMEWLFGTSTSAQSAPTQSQVATVTPQNRL